MIRTLLFACCLIPCLQAASVSGIVKDPAGAPVTNAAVSLGQLHTTTDAQGRFRFDEAAAGSQTLQIAKDGFEPATRPVRIADKSLDLTIALKLKAVTQSIQVSAKRSPLANSDPNYIALRGGRLTHVYRVNNLVIKRDVGAFTFRSGSFSFLPPVLGQVATGVFIGDGNFQLKPAFDLAVKHLHRIAGIDAVDEDFTAMVVYFSDATFDEIQRSSQLVDESAAAHELAFKRVKDTIETRRDPPGPGIPNCCPPLRKWGLSTLENLLNHEDIPNYEAEILAELYNPAQRGSFRAFLQGKKHPDLRFIFNPLGALPMLPAPEEVALINFEPESDVDGIWYLCHTAAELTAHQASSDEDKRLIATDQYRIQTFIRRQNLLGNDPDLSFVCDLTFRSLAAGTRMVKFDLVPDLQVARVSLDGKEIPFIQEGRSKDGSFYLQMPEPMAVGRSYQVTFEYSGGEILQSHFGNPPPRRVWYPTPAGAANRALFDLTFHVPRGITVVSTGNLISQSREGDFDVTEWKTDVPIPQAVFRYLQSRMNGRIPGSSNASIRSTTDQTTGMQLDVYTLPPPVDRVAQTSTKDLLVNTTNALHVFNAWFGPPAARRLSVVQALGCVDSFPGLVCASPFMGGFSASMSQALAAEGRAEVLGAEPRANVGPRGDFATALDEAFSLQISRQWWGNTIIPATFHDAWLSAGFTNFSGSVFDMAVNPAEFDDHWGQARNNLIHQPPSFIVNMRPNDTGPLWMGTLNSTDKTPGAGYIVNSLKGGYVLNMLRSLMWDGETGDSDFRAMVQDFVKQFANRPVSTEDFEGMVEKHMKPSMELDDNHRIDWFFSDWVYSTDLPSYHLDYSVKAQEGGKFMLTGNLTQSGVSPGFRMLVPVFAEVGGKKMRLKSIPIAGDSTKEFKVIFPSAPKHVYLNLNHDVLADKADVKEIK